MKNCSVKMVAVAAPVSLSACTDSGLSGNANPRSVIKSANPLSVEAFSNADSVLHLKQIPSYRGTVSAAIHPIYAPFVTQEHFKAHNLIEDGSTTLTRHVMPDQPMAVEPRTHGRIRSDAGSLA